MEEEAIMHSELQFECSDVKQITEGEMYNLSSNAERMHREESSQLTEHVLGHPAGTRFSTVAIVIMRQRIDQKLGHDIPRHQVKQVICSLCGTEQEVHQNCINCGVCMGRYFCGTCKLFDDNVSKKQYHCGSCGICRTGGSENVFHCDKGGCCYLNLLKNNHACVEKAMHHDCPVCFEYLFESMHDIAVLPCGHTIHQSCLNEMREHFQYACPLCSKSVFEV